MTEEFRLKNHVSPFYLVLGDAEYSRWTEDRKYFTVEYKHLLDMFENEEGLLPRNQIVVSKNYIAFSIYDFLYIRIDLNSIKVFARKIKEGEECVTKRQKIYQANQKLFVIEPWMKISDEPGVRKSLASQTYPDSFVHSFSEGYFISLIYCDNIPIGLEAEALDHPA